MSEKHTPGPWNACCVDTEAHYVFGPNGDETICIMSHNDPSESVFESASGIVTKKQRRANARLIAAAPDMLEALEIAMECGLATGIDGSYPIAWSQMQSAIAKAKGETQ